MTRLRRCLGCRTLTSAARCPACRSIQRAKYRGTWPAHAQAAIDAHRANFGNTCPGWRTPPHPTHDLTLDHGPPERVLCRACNTRKRRLDGT